MHFVKGYLSPYNVPSSYSLYGKTLLYFYTENTYVLKTLIKFY